MTNLKEEYKYGKILIGMSTIGKECIKPKCELSTLRNADLETKLTTFTLMKEEDFQELRDYCRNCHHEHYGVGGKDAKKKSYEIM